MNDLTQLADSYYQSTLGTGGEGDQLQIDNTIWSVRSFTNGNDYYYVAQDSLLVRVEHRGALTLGEPIATRTTSEEADRGGLAVVTADGEVFPTTDAVIGALGIQAAESREVVHVPPPTRYQGVGRSSFFEILPSFSSSKININPQG